MAANARATPGELWLGLDVGTQSVRALVASDRGEIRSAASRPLTSRRDAGRHEQDPLAWWTALAGACREALAAVPAGRLRGAALCATSGTVLLADAAGRPLTPGLMYDDARARPQHARLERAVGARLEAVLGARVQLSWALPKLLWLLEHGPATVPGARVAHQPDVLVRRLVGHEVPSDASHALKTGYDVARGGWPRAELDELGVPGDVLPEVVPPGTGLGAVCAEAQAETGIPAGTPVVAGMTDGCAAQLAAGAVDVGRWNSVLGTTLVLKGVTRQPLRDPAGAVYAHRSPDGDWWPGGASSVGAGVLSARFPGRDLPALDALAARHEPAGAIAYPLAGRGERFPFAAPEAEGFILGEPDGEADRYAAVLQGVAFVERLCFDLVEGLGAPVEGAVTLTGGGARSRYWCQLRADVLRRPVRLLASAEPALGMAFLAAAGIQGRPVAEVVREGVRVREELEPRPGAFERLQAPYLRLVGELEGRGWLPAALAAGARAAAAA